jgi:hypothetical protein
MERLRADMRTKADVMEFSQLGASINETLDHLGKEILLKASIKDMWTLLDVKANINDVNSAFKSI